MRGSRRSASAADWHQVSCGERVEVHELATPAAGRPNDRATDTMRQPRAPTERPSEDRRQLVHLDPLPALKTTRPHRADELPRSSVHRTRRRASGTRSRITARICASQGRPTRCRFSGKPLAQNHASQAAIEPG